MNAPTTTCPDCDGNCSRLVGALQDNGRRYAGSDPALYDEATCPRCDGRGTVDLDDLSAGELDAIAGDADHPLHRDAYEILEARHNDWASRRTPAGGEA